MEAQFDDELHVLVNALRQETFRFILIGHNRYSIYKDIAAWLPSAFPNRFLREMRLKGKDYRQITDEIIAFKKGIILIPDFDWLFQEENEDVCVAFNQRRDAFARLDIAFICFIEPNGFIKVPKKVPDWWSLRSLELDFYRETPDATGEFIAYESETTSLGGQLKTEKQAELERLLRQIEGVNLDNTLLLNSLYSQIGMLYLELSSFESAKSYFEKSLLLSREIENVQSESTALNNISQVYKVRGDYDEALHYLQQSLTIAQNIGDTPGESIILNNISQIYYAQENYDTALQYLQQALNFQQQIGDTQEKGVTLNNLAITAHAQGNYEMALQYLQQSLAIAQNVGDARGEGGVFNNLSQIYKSQGDYEMALEYLKRSLKIAQNVGDARGEGTILNNIGQNYDDQGNYETALQYLQQSLSIRQQIGDQHGVASTLSNMGAIYFEEYKDMEKAAPLLMQAYTILKQIGSPRVNVPESYISAIKEQIGIERYNEIAQSVQDNSGA